jgi:hypothetical protein
MKLECPRCESADVFSFWEKREKDDWALCTNCFKRAPLYKFRIIDPDPEDSGRDGYWDYIDDWIKEHKINNR